MCRLGTMALASYKSGMLPVTLDHPSYKIMTTHTFSTPHQLKVLDNQHIFHQACLESTCILCLEGTGRPSRVVLLLEPGISGNSLGRGSLGCGKIGLERHIYDRIWVNIHPVPPTCIGSWKLDAAFLIDATVTTLDLNEGNAFNAFCVLELDEVNKLNGSLQLFLKEKLPLCGIILIQKN